MKIVHESGGIVKLTSQTAQIRKLPIRIKPAKAMRPSERVHYDIWNKDFQGDTLIEYCV
jgi:hypothetical protein